MLRIDPTEADSIKRLSAGEWSKLMEYLRDLCTRATGEVLVVGIDEMTETVLTSVTISLAEAREHLLAEVEQTLEPDRMRWLSP